MAAVSTVVDKLLMAHVFHRRQRYHLRRDADSGAAGAVGGPPQHG